MEPIKQITAEECKDTINEYKVVDVRGADEYVGQLGHIEGAELLTIDEHFANKINGFSKSEKILFVCKSGGRSGRATEIAKALGFTNAFNLIGGMIRWNELKLPVQRQ